MSGRGRSSFAMISILGLALARVPLMTSRIVRTETVPVARLGDAEREAMWSLFRLYYDDVTRERFLSDLSEKQRVMRLFDQHGELRGFSTLQELRGEHAGRPMLTLFSGDTVIHRENWGQKGLQREMCRVLLRAKLRQPRTRVFWFLISKGYKTYLLLKNNLTSYPDYRRHTPLDVQVALDHVAALKFPEHYNPATGVLRFPQCLGKVKAGVAPVRNQDLSNPHIRHFVRLNPGYQEGDELCCLAEITVLEVLLTALKYAVKRPVLRLARGLGSGIARLLISPTRLRTAAEMRSP